MILFRRNNEYHYIAGGYEVRLIDMFYPVGMLYYTSNASFNPNVSFGGTWVKDFEGRVPVGQATSGTFATVGATGGVETVTLVLSQIPSHNHGGTRSTYTHNCNTYT